MEELLKELTSELEAVNKKIKNGVATRSDMEDFRKVSFDIQKRIYRISQSSYTEDLCTNIRAGVHCAFHYYKL